MGDWRVERSHSIRFGMLCDKKDATHAASSRDIEVAFHREIQQALGETQGVPGLSEVAEVLSGFLA